MFNRAQSALNKVAQKSHTDYLPRGPYFDAPMHSPRRRSTANTFKALGITSTTRLAGLPDVPTFGEHGVPNYTAYTWMYLLAPAGTPTEVIRRLSAALRSATSTTEVKHRFREDGVETLDMSTPQINESLARHAAEASKLISGLGSAKQ